jgi:heterogeneous nuclear ribonucleoprotein F/H
VHIITDYGRPTGVALVEFASPQDAQSAAAKDKQMMGTRYIEVFPSSREELQRYLPRSY